MTKNLFNPNLYYICYIVRVIYTIYKWNT